MHRAAADGKIPDKRSMPNILFIKTSSLGDVIHHMPALTEARRHHPDAAFDWVVEEAFAPLVALHPQVRAVIPVASRRWRRTLTERATWQEIGHAVAAVRSRRYDTIIDTQGLLRSGLIARIARGSRHGYAAKSIREPAASLFYDLRHKVSRDWHAIARNRALTGLALGYQANGAIDYGLDRATLMPPPTTRYAVLLHATARVEKQWGEANWIAVGNAIAADGLDLLLPWGSEAERARSERLSAKIPRARVPERTPLDQTARSIAGAALVVGVDTGLVHLAAALTVPLIAIFVGSEPGLTGPLGAGPMTVLGGMGRPPKADEVTTAIKPLLAP
jgi:heptosyltransferase I